jgi:hypothetical protein
VYVKTELQGEMTRTIIALESNGCSRTFVVRNEVLSDKGVWPVLKKDQGETANLRRICISIHVPFETDVA